MKAVLLAGGLGTRLSEETAVRPKPMVEIGGRPILWHIMKIYAAHGIDEFVVCCGYRGDVIRDYFARYLLNASDVTFDLRANRMEVHRSAVERWRVTLVDTGLATMTGGRVRRVRDYVGDETFCLTYGDGVGDVDVRAVVDLHRATGALATMTAVQPEGRFGVVHFDDAGSARVAGFREKPKGEGGWINGGFFVCEPAVFDLVDGDDTVWEDGPLRALAERGRLSAYRHHGFWHPMDTLRDRAHLEALWASGRAPWRTWDRDPLPDADSIRRHAEARRARRRAVAPLVRAH